MGNMMWYTQPLGWAVGDAVDAFVNKTWCKAFVLARTKSGYYSVMMEDGTTWENLSDGEVRYRGMRADRERIIDLSVGAMVEALFEGKWYDAKVSRCNADGTYRVVWRSERSFTDGLARTSVRWSQGLPMDSQGQVAVKRRRRASPMVPRCERACKVRRCCETGRGT